MGVTVCIPARLNSSRFPKKVLADLEGKTVLQRVFERAISAVGAEKVIILCDSPAVHDAAINFGAPVIDTSETCISGTERTASALDKIQGDFIINIQGDEPFFDTDIIGKMVAKSRISDAHIFTSVYKLDSVDDLLDSNRVKVVLDHNGRALYFSRSTIPFVRDEKNVNKWLKWANFYGHVGIYGYRRKVLENYTNLVPGKLEFAEKLEQLRFLESGYAIDTVETLRPSLGIDTPKDLAKANALLTSIQSNA
ncbi:MAG: 3-deoxy-manno-octulosonate cytidylyltransferase [Puniceicoccales bacterium]|jgi:3-deoxy-manno-octulosonate cytidylyltransferase (CMP-KDO synthetase)|nr:3-deoxy-manno-octulosonate cytidylyltransferase [Puniceicoccales bacterium]